jgi:hypothetical protein
VRGARLHVRGGAGKQAFLLRGIDAGEQAAFERLGAEFPDQQVRPCEAPADGHKAG